MSDVSLRHYTELLQKSELLTPDEVDAKLREFERGKFGDSDFGDSDFEDSGVEYSGDSRKLRADSAEDAVAFAAFLLKSQSVTEWQNTHLLRGRFRGLKFGKFRVLRLIGAGGMGRVFLAEDEMLKRQVALKVLPRARSQNERALQRFHQEARALAKLDHANIVRVHDVDYREKTHYIVMEFVEGVDLAKRVDRQGPLSERVALGYIRQTALGLQHAHQNDLIRRDIKPANLLVDQTDTVKILDLGLALLQSDDEGGLTADPTKTLGTVDFISPEQALHSRNLDHRTDLYSLGCSLHFLLTSRGPFSSGPVAQRLLAHQTKEPPSVNELRQALSQPAVGEATLTLCKLLMAKSADDRPPSAADVVAYIDRFSFGEVVSKPNAAAQLSIPAGESTRETVAAGPNSTINGSSVVRLRLDEKHPSVSRTASAIQIDVKDHVPTTKTSNSVAAKTRKRRKTSTHLWILTLSGVAFIASLACLSFLLTQQPSEQPASGALDASEKTAATSVFSYTLVA
ncbi:MAG: serine/threonine-protein kinase, partial [Planctomycetota bacterium]